MNIYVEKFGGASVNSAAAVKNVEHIISAEHKKRVVVISAMGKTTNKLEVIINKWYSDGEFYDEGFDELKEYHNQIIKELFANGGDTSAAVDNRFEELKQCVCSFKRDDYNLLYDAVVSYGEKLSTLIVSAYLNSKGINNKLVKAYEVIKTDSNHRDANVCWDETQKQVDEVLSPLLNEYDLVITQGFIAGGSDGKMTTLGREGSDFSAAVLAHCLQAKSMTVWKDVPGLLNADPKRIDKTVKIVSMPYTEAVELSYYGASVIHPKTVKPLENKQIPLYIKSFVNPSQQGTVICKSESVCPIVPNYIFKDNQILLSILPKDLSFLAESKISIIFSVLAKHKIRVNLMQNSAISFSVCFDENRNLLPALLEDLQEEFNVRYNTGLQLVTVRHYTQDAVREIIKGKRILIEQKSRITAQYLINSAVIGTN